MSRFSSFRSDALKKPTGFPKFLPYHYPAIFDRSRYATRDSQGVVCALLCATAAEAFLNDFTGWYELVSKNFMAYGDSPFPKDNYLNEEERELLKKIKNSENKKNSVLDRFQIFHDWDKSAQPYQDFKDLITIRNAIAHVKTEQIHFDESKGVVVGYPKFLNNFFQKKIIEKSVKFDSWIELIENKEFCLWCQNAVYEMVKKSIEFLPDTNTKINFHKEIYFPFDVNDVRKRLE